MSVFDDWVDQSRAWHRDIRVIPDPEVELCTRFAGEIDPEIGFGRYAGTRRWENLSEVPSQEIRDELLKLIVSQADSEVRAVEQARELYDSAPTEHDRRRLERHMTEETRHGWQMAYLLVTYFGAEGKSEATKLLERRATRGEAQLEMFNIKLNWVDVFSWHNWGDRVGKYQLTMFGGCGFAPFARSITPMLKEEGFHLVIGHQGLQRIAAAGRVPVELHQRYLNRMMWICYDAFGGAESRRAARIHDGRRAAARERAGAQRVHRRGAQAAAADRSAPDAARSQGPEREPAHRGGRSRAAGDPQEAGLDRCRSLKR
jgi:1,2-phenylacetyl-CoA epoxidase catalytic subunit